MSDQNGTSTLSLNDSLLQFLTRYDQAPNKQIEEDLGLLQMMITDAQAEIKGAFSTAEALFFCQVLFSATTAPTVSRPLGEVIEDACRKAVDEENLHRKWELDPERLMSKVSSLSMAQNLAVWHNVKKFWVNPDWDHVKVAALFDTSDA